MYTSGSVLRHLPTWASRWLGYRPPQAPTLPAPHGRPGPSSPPPPPQHVVWIWSWIGAFSGISVIQAVFGQARYFVDRGVTPIVPSYGATAVLVYGVIDSPLAQPRNVFFGTFIGSFVGVCITKLFLLLPQERFDELAWLAAALACATTIVLMQITKTAHPPAGATAFLPALDPSQRALGWYYIPVVLLSSVLAVAIALVTNNVQRRYPLYWWNPPAPPAKLERRAAEIDGGMPEASDGEMSEKKLFGTSAHSVRTSTRESTTGRSTPNGDVMEVGR